MVYGDLEWPDLIAAQGELDWSDPLIKLCAHRDKLTFPFSGQALVTLTFTQASIRPAIGSI